MRIPSWVKPFLPASDKGFYRLAVSCGMFVLGLSFASWAARIPDVKAALALNDAQLGLALFASPIGQLPAMIFASWFIKRYGSRLMVLWGMFCYSASLVMLALSPNFSTLFVALIFFGCFNSFLNICNNTQAVGVEILYKRSIMAKFHGCWSLGGVVGGLIGALFAGFAVTPLVHFSVIFVLSTGILLLTRRWLMKEDIVPAKPKEGGATRSSFVRPDAFLVLLGVIGFGSMATEGTMYDWNAVYYVSQLGATGFSARFGYLACMIAMVSARFVADGFINKYGDVFVLRVSAISMTLGLLLMVFFPTLSMATIGSAFVGFGMASVVPICYSLAGRSTLVSPSTAISMVSAISFLGFVLGPPLIGNISYLSDLRIAFALMLIAPLSVLFLAPIVNRLKTTHTVSTKKSE